MAVSIVWLRAARRGESGCVSRGGLTPRNASIVGLSVALGMGIAMTDGCLAGPGMPERIS
ncbi:MAG: hypothetical protein SOH69_03220 [Olsenella sp.]